MSPRPPRRKATRSRRTLKPVVLIFGEDRHDSDSIKILAEYLHPKLAEGTDIQVRRDPPSLTRDATEKKVGGWMQRIGELVKTESTLRDIHAVLVHQDSDGPDPAGCTAAQLSTHLQSAISTVRTEPVVPVQEIEAWWLIFPDAVRAVKPTVWRDLKLPGGNSATVSDPKARLIKATRHASQKYPYQESDSVTVAQQISRRALSPTGTNPSWDQFEQMVRGL